MNKKGFELSFGWIFAILVGAVIIFLAIYFSVNIIKEGRSTQDTLAGQQLGIILSPVETSLESAKTAQISFPVLSRVYNTCDTAGNFGTQKISLATQSGVGAQWQKPGTPSIFYNKYLFSPEVLETKNANVLAKPFNFPYRVADVMLMWSGDQKYCFINAPTNIQDELTSLSITNMNFTSDSKDCDKKSIKVCFVSSGCDIDVNLNSQSVKKYGRTMFYVGDDSTLLYAAIFSDPVIYECQIQRLMKRASELAVLYEAKTESLSPRGCTSGLEGELAIFASQALSLNESIQLRQLSSYADDMARSNSALSCRLF